MPRPRDKEALFIESEKNFKKLQDLIDSMSLEKQEEAFPFEDRDHNVRDVLIHLYEWQQLLLNFVKSNQNGENKPFLPEPYNWKTYPAMNIGFWEKHQNTPLDKAKKLLQQSHQEVMKMCDTFTNEELFTKKYYSWTGTTNLGSYCISASSSHYDWAIKKLRKFIKETK